MAQPLQREPVLEGLTYKLRWPSSDHAIYITINDINQGGRRRPFEIFINSKNLEHYAWTVALTRMISAIFRRGGDVTFVVEELKAVFDPQGGQWINGRYVPSLLAAIGGVVESHMLRIGFLSPRTSPEVSTIADPYVLAGSQEKAAGGPGDSAFAAATPRGRICPRCNHPALHHREGCWVCDNCSYSKCG
jgi:ribonucleoside-diphosphate reductase alpha chain